jgi:hypothetical protein
MPMLNIMEYSARYENEWVVLDKQHNVIDHGTDLESLWDRNAELLPKLTFYFASSQRP